MSNYPYVYRFKPLQYGVPKYKDLFGQRCRVLARGKMNSALVEFENGTREIISRNALRKVKV